jgi:L-ascorbate metabolism protein UlaG (beta-lactamase superfamily)
MNIVWHGQSCFQIEARHNKSELTSIIIDPLSEEIGLRPPKLQADIVLVTQPQSDYLNVKGVGGDPFLIQEPGEYEIKKVFIQGISACHDQKKGQEGSPSTMYTIEAEDLRLCHLGDLNQKELTEEQVDKIGDIDILMIPIGGTDTISAKEAIKTMSQIEPRIIVPMYYQIPKLKTKTKLDGLDKFLKIMGIKSINPLNKLSIKSKDISPEEAKIIVLKP